jgi:serine/threonine protein kinase
VGSADFVSPEVLRSEVAGFASDIWAFGCILYQLFTGRPPFRAATDYLTFQRILKRDFEHPTDIDSDAKDLIDQILVRCQFPWTTAHAIECRFPEPPLDRCHQGTPFLRQN